MVRASYQVLPRQAGSITTWTTPARYGTFTVMNVDVDMSTFSILNREFIGQICFHDHINTINACLGGWMLSITRGLAEIYTRDTEFILFPSELLVSSKTCWCYNWKIIEPDQYRNALGQTNMILTQVEILRKKWFVGCLIYWTVLH